jgi:HrpA-like RNA helicase
MQAFEPGEIVRTPLDSVILTLRTILGDGEVTGTLLDCIEPPQMATIDRSFESLYNSDFISAPSDACEITALGNRIDRNDIDFEDEYSNLIFSL